MMVSTFLELLGVPLLALWVNRTTRSTPAPTDTAIVATALA